MAVKEEENKNHPSGSGILHGYQFEIRTTHEPFEAAGMMITNEWKHVYHPKTKGFGIPAKSYEFEPGMDYFGLQSLVVIQALRWWFLSVIDAEIGALAVETRIVKHRVKYNISCEPIESMYGINGLHRPIVAEMQDSE